VLLKGQRRRQVIFMTGFCGAMLESQKVSACPTVYVLFLGVGLVVENVPMNMFNFVMMILHECNASSLRIIFFTLPCNNR
jgi:hypothetical protein